MLYKDYEGNEITELDALEAVETLIAARGFYMEVFEFVRDELELSDDVKLKFNEKLREFDRLLDYCSPAGEPVRIYPETYKNIQDVSYELMTIFGKQDMEEYVRAVTAFANQDPNRALELATIADEISDKYDKLREA